MNPECFKVRYYPEKLSQAALQIYLATLDKDTKIGDRSNLIALALRDAALLFGYEFTRKDMS